MKIYISDECVILRKSNRHQIISNYFVKNGNIRFTDQLLGHSFCTSSVLLKMKVTVLRPYLAQVVRLLTNVRWKYLRLIIIHLCFQQGELSYDKVSSVLPHIILLYLCPLFPFFILYILPHLVSPPCLLSLQRSTVCHTHFSCSNWNHTVICV
jgi:hypothetical protein